jgi:photosystem II stability/assembly factor-like uncharacterized protein
MYPPWTKSILLWLVVFAALAAGTETSTGGAWTALGRPVSSMLTRLHFLDNRNGWISGHAGTILRTTDGGEHWELQETGLTAEIVDVFMLDAQRGWALGSIRYDDTVSWYGTKVLTTTNGGTNWIDEPPPGAGRYYTRVFFADSLHGWLCGAYGDLLMSSDGGIQWHEAAIDSGPRWFWPLLNLKFFSRQTGYAMGGTWDLAGLLWKTTDGGSNWMARQVSPEPVYDLHFLDSLHILGIVGDLDYGVSMINTSDGGTTWNYRFLGMPGLPTALSFRTEYEGWAALGFPGTMLTTTDAGESWTTVPTPGGIPVYDLVFTDSSTGFAVGDSGVILKYAATTLAAGEPMASERPEQPVLGPAYPDPWNASTRFTYTLPRQEWVRLTLVNLLGEEVLHLVDGASEAGVHTVSVDGNDLPSGLYFCVLQAGAMTAVRKSLLVR